MSQKTLRKNKRPWLKPVVFLLSLFPLIAIVGDGLSDQLSANPIEDITHRTGEWALRFLLLTLAVTPLRRFAGWTWQAPLRRMLGLYAFFYAFMHFATWLVLDQFFAWSAIVEDILERPYITIGFTALVLLLPLALTSTNGMVKRLGGKRWKSLHQLVYPIAMLAVLHFYWLVKADITEPVIYAAVLLLLLVLRLERGKARG